MLHILWLIIKWILILLGILIGLILMILLLLLFCPIRYNFCTGILGAGRSENKIMFFRDSFGKI